MFRDQRVSSFAGRLGLFNLVQIIWVLFLTGQALSQTNPDVSSPLRLGSAVERRYSGGQKEIFEFDCQAGQFNRLTIDQKGIDVVFRLLDEQQGVTAEYDADPRLEGQESVEFVCTIGKQYASVEPRNRSAKPGTVVIMLSEQRGATDKEKALFESRKLLARATALWRAAKYDEALPLAEQGLALRERELGQDHPDVGLALFTIANIYSDKPDVNISEAFYIRALDNRIKALGSDHYSLASIYNNYGVLLKDQGQYAKAESNYERALSIRERNLEPNHLLIASTLNNLASVYRLRGNETKATELYRRVLAIRENALGPDHPDVATALNNVVDSSWDLAKAEPYYKRALAIREAKLDPDHPDIAQTLYNLALLYSEAGDSEKAQAACDRALGIFQRSIGNEHPFTTYPMNLSGVIAKNKGDFTKATEIFERTIALKEKVQGPMHPDLGGTLANAAHLYLITGDIEKAAAAQERADRIFEYNISLNLLSGSEAEKLSYMNTLTSLGDLSISLRIADKNASRRTTEIAFLSVLQRKGRVLDSVSEAMNTRRRRMSANDRTLLANLAETAAKMSKLVLDGPGQSSLAEYNKKLDVMELERDRLEKEISRTGRDPVDAFRQLDVAKIKAAIPVGSALVEFALYNPVLGPRFEFIDGKAVRNERGKNLRYIAFVLVPAGEPRAFDLGSAHIIDEAISKFRSSLRSYRATNVMQTSKRVSELVWDPIRSALAGVDRVLISPEGELNILPFEALSHDGRFLVEEFSISYLTSGRDLMRPPGKNDPVSSMAIVAHPDFNEPAELNGLRPPTGGAGEPKPGVTSTRRAADTYFAPLTGTAQEAQALKALFPDAVLLMDTHASETAIRSLRSPKILHIATHGFFRSENEGTGSISTAPKQSSLATTNPLLQSGLAFSGANNRGGSAENDGIVTALEATGLDLWGTKLVVLSACDTGVGAIRNGEGVYGLRRSFRLAGAESLVMSLWPVSDLITRELMVGYYRNLKNGIGRGDALRRVQLEMIKNPKRSHPFYWASFIQTGEWANLEGSR